MGVLTGGIRYFKTVFFTQNMFVYLDCGIARFWVKTFFSSNSSEEISALNLSNLLLLFLLQTKII